MSGGGGGGISREDMDRREMKRLKEEMRELKQYLRELEEMLGCAAPKNYCEGCSCGKKEMFEITSDETGFGIDQDE